MLETIQGDSWQIGKLRDYLARPDIVGSESFTVRTSAHHQARQVLDTLRRHLRSHRLRAVVIKHHDQHAVPPLARRDTAASVAQPATASAGSQGILGAPGSPAAGPAGSRLPAARAPVSIADWSTGKRLEVLLEDALALPVLERELKARIRAMISGEALAQHGHRLRSDGRPAGDPRCL
ncbi:MAG: hypothetical protein ACRYG8_18455 [Janthinobacterium lividum]